MERQVRAEAEEPPDIPAQEQVAPMARLAPMAVMDLQTAGPVAVVAGPIVRALWDRLPFRVRVAQPMHRPMGLPHWRRCFWVLEEAAARAARAEEEAAAPVEASAAAAARAEMGAVEVMAAAFFISKRPV